MAGESPSRRTVQLDKAEREHLEAVVESLRERVEDNVRFQLERRGLDDAPDGSTDRSAEDRRLVDAIELEGGDGHAWDEAFESYVAGVGYTVVNRLAALRCMEVRGFVDEEVTVFKENGLTPAAETLVHDEFLLEGEAVLRAYHDACDDLAEEVGILFDRSSAYSLVDPDEDTFEDLCRRLDDVPDEVWRADDVLGWVYEYYNRPVVEALDAKNALEPEDVGPANQFYTPHWVVRMLADNSLGKLYLEATGRESSMPDPGARAPEARKNRSVTPEDAPGVPELCTYLLPDDADGDAPSFDHPRELRVIDPACGSGHFLLYAFDVLERIWWAETDLDRAEIPAKILEHNLYGVDIDLRSCQLSAFNLYLKARTRAEAEGNDGFTMPTLGVVCADARVAEIEEAVGVLDDVAGTGTDVRDALDDVVAEFQQIEALGSLLDVQGALSETFMDAQTDVLEWGGDGPHTLNGFLRDLRAAVSERTTDSFGERNLRSFLNLLVVLTQEYDVALMNPPYGARGRMPDDVQSYVEDHYSYTSEYYVNFFEACDRLVKPDGRIGMLVPWSFMFNRSFQAFREDFVGDRGSFDFFAEFGYDVLDNATVGTVGTVVRSDAEGAREGTFIRLSDVAKAEKERSFLRTAFGDGDPDVDRLFTRDLSEFGAIPGTPLTYWVPWELRKLYDAETVVDADNAGVEKADVGSIKIGLQTGNNDRFIRSFWERPGDEWVPLAKGGRDTWLLPRVTETVLWADEGREIVRYPNSNVSNAEHYFREGVTYNRVKRSGRRFGYLHPDSIFGNKGPVILGDVDQWLLLAYANSRFVTYLMLAQTTERMWEGSQVAKLPWPEELAANDDAARLARHAIGHLVTKRQYDFDSPHYRGPVLLAVLGIDDPLPSYDHPHRDLRKRVELDAPSETVSADSSLSEMGVAAARHLERVEANLQGCADAIDDAVFDCFGLTADQREMVRREIALRTIEDPRDRPEHDPDAITAPTEAFPEMVKDLVLHLAIRAVQTDDDGIVPLSDVGDEPRLLERIEAEFSRLFGDHATDRLVEVDRVLGDETADDEAYPNLREWLETELFDYHVSAFDRTPILWRLTTERLVSDPEGEGFACLVDYHQLDASVFDRLRNRYLEPRKAVLRERRSAANRRRSDDSLSASDRAAAAEASARCESGLEQIAAFEERLADLAQPSPREWPAENRAVAREATEQVAAFRAETASRLETLDALAARDDVDVEELFSPTFYETVQANRDEWLDALDDLQRAFEAYARDGTEPVAAHRYDLLEYVSDLVGSAHYASNGILFTTYYFDKFDAADQARLDDGDVSGRRRLLSELASGLDEYRSLADDVESACDELASDLPSDWADRARDEITTAGYRPNRKHGVEVNVAPLAEAEIVPKVVDDDVL
ncbi:MAG: BREX-5 system adenine-specific DNA-methyltransferase PglX [Haloferacaceae archaeon]